MYMLDANYVVGLVDGEGSFTAYVKHPDESKERIRRARVEPKFYLKLIGEDKKTLDELQRFFGCGNVYFQKDSRPNHQDCFRFEVTKRQDLIDKIIPFFKRNQLRLKSKTEDFRLFCEIVKRVIKNEHLTDQGLRKIHKLKEQMH